MRIAQVAPLYESVPPGFYGGTERIVSYLTEELVRKGHEVTLFASGDSTTRARLIPMRTRATRLDSSCCDSLAGHIVMLEKVAAMQHEFDLIHYHVDYLHFSLSRRGTTPHVTTLHGRLDLPELQPVYDEFRDMPLISISNAQRQPLPQANWIGTVYHGLPSDLLTLSPRGKGYFAFLGRISQEKRLDRAIDIATRIGKPLKIAAKVDKADVEYFDEQIKWRLSDPLVEYLGEIGDDKKSEFLGGADALLFPIDWPEPFGLVVIEALACGTPVVAFGCGSIPELIDDGVTGFVVDNVEDAVDAAALVGKLDRHQCRAVFEQRFTDERMAEDYVALYERVVMRAGAGAAA
jgi:glycosyltransferase involved in cell wall biosynthesis